MLRVCVRGQVNSYALAQLLKRLADHFLASLPERFPSVWVKGISAQAFTDHSDWHRIRHDLAHTSNLVRPCRSDYGVYDGKVVTRAPSEHEDVPNGVAERDTARGKEQYAHGIQHASAK
jgi:hypothetical protein